MTYCDFKPGDEVEVVKDDGGVVGQRYRLWLSAFNPDAPEFDLEIGATFTIRDVEPHPHIDDLLRVDVGGAGLYPSYIFRKVQRRDLSAWLKTATRFEEPTRAPAVEPA